MKLLWFIVLMFLYAHAAFSQTRSWQIKEIIDYLETNSALRFSYEDNLINEQSIRLDSFRLDDIYTIIPILETDLRLRFEKIDSTYYIIRPFKATDQVSVCGLVLDQNGKPIPGVLISGDIPLYTTVTDNDGYFSINQAPYELSITLRHLGFNARRSSISELFSNDCAKLILIESVGFLEALTIDDYLTVGITKERNHIHIFPSEINILPGYTEPDLMQSIQLAPGVNSPYETSAGIHVRGGSPDQNLVLWNGIRTYNQGHFFGMISAFNPYIADEVTFIKSGTNPQYGERVSSTIDIRTADFVPEKIYGGWGFNMIHTDGYLNAPLIKDKLSVQVSGRRSFNDLIKTFTYENFATRVFQNTKIAEIATNEQAKNRFFFHDFTTNVNYKINKDHSLHFSSLFDNNALVFTTNNQSTLEVFSDQLNTKNEGYSLRWSKNSVETFSFDLSANYSKYLLSYAFNRLFEDTLDIASKKNLIEDFGLSFHTTYPIAKNQRIKSGYQFSQKQVRYAFENETPTYSLVLDVADNELKTHALFAEYQLEYGKGSSLQLGSRLNYYQELDRLYLEPRLFIEQKITEPLSLIASGEYRTQTVSQIRESVVSDLSLENKVWTLSSNDGFPVTSSYQISAGSILDKNDWYAEAEVYYKDISGITTLTFGYLNPIGNEFSNGHSRIRGLDFFLKKQFTGYKTWLSYSYIYAQNQFKNLNNEEPFPGNWNIEHTIKWSHFYSFNQFQCSLGWLWHTGKAYTEVQENLIGQGPVSVYFDRINEHNLPVYHRLDLSLVYDFKPQEHKNLKYRIGVSVLNLYNRKNQLNREYRTTPSLENRLIETNIYALGITPNIVFRVFF